MKRVTFALLAAAALFGITANARAQDPQAGPYQVVATVKIGGEGRWDYIYADPTTHHLYVTRGSHTLVLDDAAKQLADIPGQKRAHGVAIAPDVHRGFISDGEPGSLHVFDTESNAVLGNVEAAADADCVLFDPATRHALAFCGDANKMVAIAQDVDPAAGKADASVDLGGAPEYAAVDGQGKAFVNIADKDEIAVVDTKVMKVIARYPTTAGKSPTGLAMDVPHRRLFIGCRNKKMLVMNADDGKILATFDIGAGNDATAFDRGYAFASCGDGTLTVIKETDAAHFAFVQTLKTAPGARTMTIDPGTGTLYLPTADLGPAPEPSADHPHPRPTPVPGTFKIVVAKVMAARE